MKTYTIYPNVMIEEGAQIDDYVIIGIPPRGFQEGELETVIGRNAVIRSHTVLYAGNRIGENFQTGHHTFVRECNKIGDNVSIGTNSVVEHHLSIGNNVRIHCLSGIGEYSTLEEDCWLGPFVVCTNALHPTCPKVKQCLKGPTIKRGAIVGAHVTLHPRITIGEYAFISAGAVVIKDVPPYKVMFGHPARVVSDIDNLTCPYEYVDKPYTQKVEAYHD
jgi:acetyltransferase-like isoleucine patch superfamily enzyme